MLDQGRSTRQVVFPTTRDLMLLVAYAAVVCSWLASMSRIFHKVDFSILATLTVLAAPHLIHLAVWLVEPPGERRAGHLFLVAILVRLTLGVVLLAWCVAIWLIGWADLPFFARIEGRHWLLNWMAIPLCLIACGRVALAVVRGTRSKKSRDLSRRDLPKRLRQLVFAVVFVLVAAIYHDLAPRLMDGELVNLSRLLMTFLLLALLYRLRPGRCPSCSRRAMIRLPDRPPFTARGSRFRPGRCLTCWAECREPTHRLHAEMPISESPLTAGIGATR